MNAADKEIIADFVRARKKTIALLKRIPPKLLNKTAKGEAESTAELFAHIAKAVDSWMARCMKDGGPLPDWSANCAPSRAALVKMLQASQKRLLKFFNANKGAAMNKTYERTWGKKSYRFIGRSRVLYLTQHEVHHRGKIVLALRQWGFTKIPFLPFE